MEAFAACSARDVFLWRTLASVFFFFFFFFLTLMIDEIQMYSMKFYVLFFFYFYFLQIIINCQDERDLCILSISKYHNCA